MTKDKLKKPKGKVTELEQHDGARKQRKIGNNDRAENSNSNSAVVKQTERQSAKRKINFDENQTTSQSNLVAKQVKQSAKPNNVSYKNDKNSDARNGRNSHRSRAQSKKPQGVVKWTKEFLEKARKSNERQHRSKANEKDFTLQESGNQGDGITIAVEEDGLELMADEELDYDDDLSIEAEDKIVENSGLPQNSGVEQQPQPGTSSGENGVDGCGAITDVLRFPSQINPDAEEQLYNNPVMQRMMQRFFNNQFKTVQQTSEANQQQKEQGKLMQLPSDNLVRTELSVKVKKGNQVSRIKSPSDTTIYAPALQRKLTPNNQDLVGTNLECSNLTGVNNELSVPTVPEQVINDVAHFVEAVRLDQHPSDEQRRRSSVTGADLENAQKRAGHAILEAEKFRANVGSTRFANVKF